jgi:hypothetical protein
MGIKDEAVFDKVYEECNPVPRQVEGRGEYMLDVSGDVLKNARFQEIMDRASGPYGHYFFWFQTAEQRQFFRAELTEIIANQCAPDKVVFKEENGPQVMTQPKVFATLEYKGKEYEVTDTFTYGYPVDAAIYYWAEGNFSCDCNRRNWINRQHPGAVDPSELKDKLRIELID